MIVHVILPLALNKHFSYAVPQELIYSVSIGKRVDVLFNKKHYTGLITKLIPNESSNSTLTYITDVIDDYPILTPDNLLYWQWISHYYVCTIGEVMTAALPGSFRIQSDTLVHLREGWENQELIYTESEKYIFEIINANGEISIEELSKTLTIKKEIKLISNLISRNILATRTALKKQTKAKPYEWLKLTETYIENLAEALNACVRSKKQTDALLAYYQSSKAKGAVRMDHLLREYKIDRSIIKALIKKNILYIHESFQDLYSKRSYQNSELSEDQKLAYDQIKVYRKNNKPILLHGVTGSGKTHVYTELIKDRIDNENQVLFMVPEVALTVQLVTRLRQIFEQKVIVYNYLTSVKDRILLWKKLINGEPVIVLGSRSSIFLPFTCLDLVIVDEEQDRSYKQQDPNPRYQGRDAAIYLAHSTGAQIILGTATPSFETYYNVEQNKFEIITLNKRYGNQELPEINLVNLRKSHKLQNMQGIFAGALVQRIEQTLEDNRQVIIFQNRRGFHTTFSCTVCDWISKCHQCDVSLTYHKFSERLHCHLCGFSQKIPSECPTCSSIILNQKGYGTERIQEELKELFPLSRIARLDADTTRKKSSYNKIIRNFSEHRVDILVGTQMVSKGLDFDHVGLVGIVNGDSMIFYPDFRSLENAYQMLTQVSGRSGRKEKKGEVLIQTYHPTHELYKFVQDGDFIGHYQQELIERRSFFYPPFSRLISIEIRHKKTDRLNEAVKLFNQKVTSQIRKRMIGPGTPAVSYIKGYYRRSFLIKMEKDKSIIDNIKHEINILRGKVLSSKGLSQTRIIINVDPM